MAQSYFHNHVGKIEANSFLQLICEYSAFQVSEGGHGYVCLDLQIIDNKIQDIYVYSEGFSSYHMFELQVMKRNDLYCFEQRYRSGENVRTNVENLVSANCISLN